MLLLSILSLESFAQSDPLEKLILIAPGEYSTEEIIKHIVKSGVDISYSQAAMQPSKVIIPQEENKLETLLEQVFDLEKYRYRVRGNKILIVPRAKKNIRTHSGFKTHDTDSNLRVPIRHSALAYSTFNII